MAIRDDFAAGEVLAAADLNDTFASKLDLAGGTMTRTGTAPTYQFNETDGATDEKRWHIRADNSDLFVQALTDAGTGGGDVIAFTRSGSQVTGLSFVEGTVQKNFISTDGDSFFTSGTVRVGNATDAVSLLQNDGSVSRIRLGQATGSHVEIQYNRANGNCSIIHSGAGGFAVPAVYSTTTAAGANVNIGADNFLRRSTSSIKYKTDVEDLENDYADRVLQLRPVWFRSTANGDEAHPEWSYYGFIAEEVAEVDPRVVSFAENEDGTLEPEGVQYDRLVPHLVSIVQRQQAQIDALTARLDAAGL